MIDYTNYRDRPMGVFVDKETYPNGKYHYKVYLDRDLVGGFDVTEGGYRPYGGRKVIPTIEAATRKVLESRTRATRSILAKLEAALAAMPK